MYTMRLPSLQWIAVLWQIVWMLPKSWELWYTSPIICRENTRLYYCPQSSKAYHLELKYREPTKFGSDLPYSTLRLRCRPWGVTLYDPLNNHDVETFGSATSDIRLKPWNSENESAAMRYNVQFWTLGKKVILISSKYNLEEQSTDLVLSRFFEIVKKKITGRFRLSRTRSVVPKNVFVF